MMQELLKIETTLGDFKVFLKKLSYAMSRDECRYYLNGILFENKGGELNAVATDGHQMAAIDLKKYFKPRCVDGDFSGTIPIEAVVRLLNAPVTRIIFDDYEDDEGEVEDIDAHVASEKFIFRLTETHCYFEFGVVVEEYKLVGGKYPEWRKVLPESVKPVIKFNAKYLVNICNAMGDSFNLLEFNQNPDNKEHPILLKDENGGSFLLMPCKLTKKD